MREAHQKLADDRRDAAVPHGEVAWQAVPPRISLVCFTRCRRQAPTGRQANPTLAGGSDVASMDPEKVDEEDQHSFAGSLADMLSWGRYTEIGEDGE